MPLLQACSKEWLTLRRLRTEQVSDLRVFLSSFAIVDYKKTLCSYFKAGVCEKGKKCKYSHDLTIEQAKEANIDIYSDPRAKIGKMRQKIQKRK